MARVLVVDDDQKMRHILRTHLERAGYEVDSAEDGRSALRLFRENSADVVVTDLFMPKHDGLQLLMDLRHIQPELKVIAISGFTAPHRRGKMQFLPAARTFGAAHVLKKPFSLVELEEAVHSALAPV